MRFWFKGKFFYISNLLKTLFDFSSFPIGTSSEAKLGKYVIIDLNFFEQQFGHLKF